MAKAHNPLFSLSAAGSAGQLTYCHGTNLASETHYVRKKPRAPTGARTAQQQSCNERFLRASIAFDALTEPDRSWWMNHGETTRKYGRAWYIAEYIIQRIEAPAQPLKPIPRWTAP